MEEVKLLWCGSKAEPQLLQAMCKHLSASKANYPHEKSSTDAVKILTVLDFNSVISEQFDVPRSGFIESVTCVV
jgi:hypothetical protein